MVSCSGEGNANVESDPDQTVETSADASALETSPGGHNGASEAHPDKPFSEDVATEGDAAGKVVTGFTARGFAAVAMGLLASVPLAWLLSHAALLPFFLGLFFFVLFGLLIGAIIYRVAVPRRPYSTVSVLAGTTLVVIFGWSLSICQEAHDAPSKLAENASRRTRYIGDRTVSEFRDDVAGQIRGFIAKQYPPGGVLGFVMWAADSGKIPRGSIRGVKIPLELPHRRYVWLIRVAACIALLAFGVGSQTLLLRLKTDPIVRRMDEQQQ